MASCGIVLTRCERRGFKRCACRVAVIGGVLRVEAVESGRSGWT